jgi:DNA end-binding protein Ku
LLPAGKKPKAYAVLRDAMAKKNLAAVALVVIRTRQHLAAIMPRGERLELELLRFAHDLREPPARSWEFPKPTPQEVAMAEQLIASMTGHWTPANYRDTYRDELLKAIHEKAKTGVIEAHHVPSAGEPEANTDLLAMLQQSVKASAAKGAKHAAHAHHGTA